MQHNKEFWDKQAELFASEVNAVNFDINAEELELLNIEKFLNNNEYICDIGCGNGRTIFHMINQGIKSKFYGIDFTKGMIDAAKERKVKLGCDNAEFFNLSATSPEINNLFDFKFDKVISKRLLINLKGKDKYKAIDNIYNLLKPNGTYIMIENFNKPLQNINDIRTKIGLDSIGVHEFNEYLDEDFLDKIKDKFTVEKKIDFLSLYYFISRIFNSALSEGKDPDYMAKINQVAVEISKLGLNINIKDYSPQVMYVLKKI